MDDAAPVRMLQCIRHHGHRFQLLARIKLSQFSVLANRVAVNETHRERGLKAGVGLRRSGFINAGYARMLQSVQHQGFAFKWPERFRPRQSRLQRFQGYKSPRLVLLRLVNKSHAAFPD